jgi:hypothetical protein
MRSLLLSLETTERVCGGEISDKSDASRKEKPSYSEKCGQVRSETSVASCDKKPSHSDKKVRGDLVLTTVPESSYQETLQPCNKHGGASTMHDSHDCHRFEKDGTGKSDFRAAKKSGKKSNPIKQSFAQLSKKTDQLEKVTEKKDTKKRKRCCSNSDSDSE